MSSGCCRSQRSRKLTKESIHETLVAFRAHVAGTADHLVAVEPDTGSCASVARWFVGHHGALVGQAPSADGGGAYLQTAGPGSAVEHGAGGDYPLLFQRQSYHSVYPPRGDQFTVHPHTTGPEKPVWPGAALLPDQLDPGYRLGRVIARFQ